MTQEAQPSKEAEDAASGFVYGLYVWRGRSPAYMQSQKNKLAAIIDASHAGLREELNEERLAIEKIGEYLLPLVGTGDGTAVDAAKKAASELIGLREELERAKQDLRIAEANSPDAPCGHPARYCLCDMARLEAENAAMKKRLEGK